MQINPNIENDNLFKSLKINAPLSTAFSKKVWITTAKHRRTKFAWPFQLTGDVGMWINNMELWKTIKICTFC